MNETWKYIEGYNKQYQVSNIGNIRKIYLNWKNKYKEKIIKCEKLLKQRKNVNGYNFVGIGYKNRKNITIHRLVALTFIKKPKNKKTCVNHKDGNKLNNNVENLEWVTQNQNVIHAAKMGKMCRYGNINGSSKLNECLVKQIRFLYKNYIPNYEQIARELRYSGLTIQPEQISLAIRGVNWSCVK